MNAIPGDRTIIDMVEFTERLDYPIVKNSLTGRMQGHTKTWQ